MVIDVNTVEQILWDQPRSPGCLFQLSLCSPMNIFVVTRDTGQESYSDFFFLNVLSTSPCIHELDFKNSLASDRNYTKNIPVLNEMPECCFHIRTEKFWLCCTEVYSPNWCPMSSFKPLRLAGQSHGVSSYRLCHSSILNLCQERSV